MKKTVLIVDSVRKLVDDGNHNGFTDMCRFKDGFFLSYRSSPTGHGIFSDSRTVILRSQNGIDWKEVFSFNVSGRDVRDPHMLVFRDSLFVFSSTWLCDGRNDLSDHRGFASCTDNGVHWKEAFQLQGCDGYYIWRTATFGSKAYLGGNWRRHVDVEGDPRGTSKGHTALLESDDCRSWKEIGSFENKVGSEVAFVFENDGEIVGIVRDRINSQLCRSRPPYQEWKRTGLGRYIGGPLLAKWGGHYLVGGRKWLSPEPSGGNPKMILSFLIGDRLEDVAELPSGGDTAYPGFVPLDKTHGLLSYYSSHEGSNTNMAPSSIYLANIRIKE